MGGCVICGLERIVHMSPELRAMMNGVISALTTVFWGLPGCMDQLKDEAMRSAHRFKGIYSQYMPINRIQQKSPFKVVMI